MFDTCFPGQVRLWQALNRTPETLSTDRQEITTQKEEGGEGTIWHHMPETRDPPNKKNSKSVRASPAE